MHVLKDHVGFITETLAGKEAVLFPTVTGAVCSKQSVVDTIRHLSGGSAKDTADSGLQARTLCRWGIDPITIQLQRD